MVGTMACNMCCGEPVKARLDWQLSCTFLQQGSQHSQRRRREGFFWQVLCSVRLVCQLNKVAVAHGANKWVASIRVVDVVI